MSDYDTVISFIVKTIKRFAADRGPEQPLLPLFESTDDERFAQFMIGENGKWNDAAFGVYTTAFLIEWDD